MNATARLLLAVIATAGWSSSSHGELLTRTWNGGEATWSSDNEWSPAGAPNNGADTFHAVVSSGAALLDQDVTISELTLEGGAVAGTGGLTVLETLAWSGGQLGGEGVLTLAGPAAITSEGYVELVGSRQVVSQGATTLSTATLYLYASGAEETDGPLWTNEGAFSITGEGDIVLYNIGGGEPSFVNAAGGVFTKSGADTQTDVSVEFHNAGQVNVDSGTLALGSDGADSGLYTVASGATLAMVAGSRTMDSSSSLSSMGVLQVSGGLLEINGAATINELIIDGGAVEFGGPSYSVTGPVTFSAGIWGSAADLTLNDSLAWSGGQLGGEGVLTLAGPVDITSEGYVELVGSRQVVSQGATTLGTATLYLYASGAEEIDGPRWTNQGAFSVTGEADIALYNIGGGQPSFTNAAGGIFTKSGADTQTDISVEFHNAGQVNVDSGTLTLGNDGVDSGAYHTASGARLAMIFGTRVLDSSSTVSSAGVLQVSGGHLSIEGTAAINELIIDGGVIEFGAAPYSVTGPVTFSAGVWGSAGDLTLNNSLEWSGGQLGGEGVLTLAGPVDVTSEGFVELVGSRQVVSQGATTLSTATLYLYASGAEETDGPRWTNEGAFSVTGEADIALYNIGGGQPTFTNAAGGAFTKSGADTQTDVSVEFHNAGQVSVDSGLLNFSNAYAQTGGTLRMNGGSLATSQLLELQGGVLEGHGVITGDVSSNATIAPTGPSGVLAIDGDLSLGAESLLSIAISGPAAGAGYDYLTEAGLSPLSLDGALAITLTDDYLPDAMSTFAILRSNEDLTGALANVTNGGRLYTTDDSGSFLVNYGESSPYNNKHVVLSAFVPILPGDYNDDGRVDAADYTVWRDHLGSGDSLSNDSTPGVGPDDYLRWRNNYGRTDESFAGGPLLSASAAPEPTCWSTLLAFVALVRRRDCHRDGRRDD